MKKIFYLLLLCLSFNVTTYADTEGINALIELFPEETARLRENWEQANKINLMGCGKLPKNFWKALNTLSADVKVLIISTNDIKEIDLSSFTNLEHLDLWSNKLTRIDLSGLTKLKFLDLSHNRLEEIIGLSSLTNLEHLDLSDNRLLSRPQVPEGCKLKFKPQETFLKLFPAKKREQIKAHWEEYKKINVSGYGELPERFWEQLAVFKDQIEILDLSDNDLETVPDFREYTNLRELNIMGNRLSEEPQVPEDCDVIFGDQFIQWPFVFEKKKP